MASLPAAPAWAEERPEASTASGVLYLTDGGFVPGELLEATGADVVRWRSPAFTAPLDFPLSVVAGVQWPAAKPLAPVGDFGYDLAGGDQLYGSLVELDEDEVVVETARLGRLSIERRRLRQIDRSSGAGPIYVGPNGLAEWKLAPAEVGWREEVGLLVSDQPGTSIVGDFGLPAKASIEFEIGWKGKPNFVVALGVDRDEASRKQAFRFEVWGDQLVVSRETDREADLASLGPIGSDRTRVYLRAELDQERGRIAVFNEDGKRLAELNVGGTKPRVLGGVGLTNLSGEVRLQRLRIGPYQESSAKGEAPTGPFVRDTAGSVVAGHVTSYDTDKGELVVRTTSGETRIARERLGQVRLSNSTADEYRRQVRVLCRDGVRLSGDLVKVEREGLWLKVPGIEEPTRLPLDGLRSLAVQSHHGRPLVDSTLLGTLVIADSAVTLRLRGRLVNGREQPGASCLVWEPVGSETSSPLRPGVAGEILYKDPRLRQPAMSGIRIPQEDLGRFARTVRPHLGYTRAFPKAPHVVHLRTGDAIQAEVVRIDENGVSIRSQAAATGLIPLAKVQAVELTGVGPNPVRLSKVKRERLLTLPRMQKADPPTHMVRSRNGDFLRGRVVSLDEKWLEIEVHLETKKIARHRIARIIWLNPGEREADKAGAAKPPEGGPTRVQAIRDDGTRLTFAPDRFDKGTLSGQSDVLGACRVELEEVDRILFGSAIEQSAASLAYQRWVLHDAPEPKGGEDGADSGRTAGTQSALVGQPAPDFALQLLDGKSFRLSQARGRVLVLDFWATWCGPCLQAMPQVERVTREFADKDVQLVAVNLQEAPKEITAMLERHKLTLTVALDVDGEVAAKYGARAIPQTVVVDRDGKVARLFVGGGPHLEEQLREAIRSVLEGGKTEK